MKLKTTKLHPKVPVQAVTTLVVAALAHYGIDLDADVSVALGAVLGFAAGYIAPAAPVVAAERSSWGKQKGEAGYGLVELLIALILLLVFIWLLFALIH